MWPFTRIVETFPEKLVIIDHGGQFEISQEYRDMGVNEGWLTLSGEYKNHHDEIVVYYCHSPPGWPGTGA